MNSVLKPSDASEIKDYPVIVGPNFDNESMTLDDVLGYYTNIGYSASSVG